MRKNQFKSGFISVFLILALVIAIGAGSYFVFNKKPQRVENPSASNLTPLTQQLPPINDAKPISSPSKNMVQIPKSEPIKDNSGFSMNVDGQKVSFTEGNPVGSSVEIRNGKLNIATIRQEGGIFELTGFDTTNLHIGNFSGSYFNLSFISSPYKESACVDVGLKDSSTLSIEEYSATKIKGYYGGKVNCNGKIIQFQSLFNTKMPTPQFIKAN